MIKSAAGKLAVTLAVGLLLSACVPTTSATDAPTATAAAQSYDPTALPAVSSTQALAIFKDVCSKTAASHFSGAKQRMAANGVSVPSPTGTATIYSTKQDLSMQISDGPGFGKTCSLVFGTTESASTVSQAIAKSFEGPAPSDMGLLYLDPAAGRLVAFGGGKTMAGRKYFNLKLFSGGA